MLTFENKMKKIKKITLILIISGGVFFLFAPEVFPDNFQFQEIFSSASNIDVIIIFNSGGWGNTPLQEAEDFAPIIEGIKTTLENWGYNSLVVPYVRTKDDIIGKITGLKDFVKGFEFSAEILDEKIEFLTKSLPDKKIILAGLSNGGALVEETIARIPEENKDSVYGISVGIPFWHKISERENILFLDNNGNDTLAKGELGPLVSSLIKAPFKWVLANVKGEDITFSRAIQVPGHEYSWQSAEVSSQIITFLEENIR